MILEKKRFCFLSLGKELKMSAICLGKNIMCLGELRITHYYTGEDGEEADGGGERVLEVGVGGRGRRW